MIEPTGSVRLIDAKLPSNWTWVALGDLCTVRRGASPRPAGDPRYFGGAIPWFKIGDATAAPGRYIESTETTVNELGASLSVHIPKGSLIVANSGVSLGFPRIAGVPGCIHDGWLYLRDFRGVSRDYLYYFFLHITQSLRTFASGTTQPNLNTDIARRLQVPLAPASEQDVIVRILSTLDDKIEINRRTNQTLEDLASALFQSWFVDFDPVVAKREGKTPVGVPAETIALFPSHFEESELGPIPQGWHAKKLASVTETQYGYTASARSEPVGPHFLRITDMNKEPWIDWSGIPYCQADNVAKKRYGLRVGDILVSRMADPGKAGIVEEPVDAVFASYLVRLDTPPSRRYWLYYFLRSEEYLEYAEGAQGGTVQANMNAQVIVAARAAVPPEELSLAFDAVVRPLRRQIVANLGESRTLAELRDTLLGPLLSGELTIKSAEKALGAAL